METFFYNLIKGFIFVLIVLIMVTATLFCLIIYGPGIAFRYFFVSEKKFLTGEIVDIREDLSLVPIPNPSIDMTPSAQNYLPVTVYFVKVLVNNDYCIVKISYKLFKRLNKQFSKGITYFSEFCEKYNWDNIYQAVES
jgi:hypothetical protein